MDVSNYALFSSSGNSTGASSVQANYTSPCKTSEQDGHPKTSKVNTHRSGNASVSPVSITRVYINKVYRAKPKAIQKVIKVTQSKIYLTD